MKTFDKIYIIDLHGNSKKKEKCQDGTLDQNVFDIQQGVAISFFVKNPAIKAEERGIYHLDIFGKRKSKFEQISEIDLTKTAFSKINPSAPFYLFIPQNQKVREEYEKGWSLRDVFLESVSGITTADDNFLFDFKSEDLLKKINEKTGEIVDNKFIKAVNYRPFDLRKVFYIKTKKDNPYKNLQIPLGYRSRADVMGHFLDKENVGLAFCRQINQEFYHCFISNKIMESCFVSNKTGEITSIAPLYLYKKEEVMDITTETKVPNFKPEFVKMLNSHFNSFNNSPLEGLSLQKHDSRNNNSPLEGLSLQKHDSLSNNSPLEGESNGLMPFGGGSKKLATNSSLNSSKNIIDPSPHRQQVGSATLPQGEGSNREAKILLTTSFTGSATLIDFPRIPFDVDLASFNRLAIIGQELIDAHLMRRIPTSKIGEPEFEGEENFIVEKVAYNQENQRLYFNKSCYFNNVSLKVWEFKIGGYQVLDKYLKSRKDLSILEDLNHIQNIIKVLEFTIIKMNEIEHIASF